ncbi:tumor necrosis factor receptor superfamily member 5 [Anableps anableps]
MFGFLVLLLSVLMVMNAAQPLCDTLTQYEDNGQCCNMCEPGKKLSILRCKDPVCEQCSQNEYQETYNIENKCVLQPYCDPNNNFKTPVYDRTKLAVCMCKQGFHCSSERCMTCVPHKQCGPGEEVRYKGNHTHDTVCQRCADGTFSNVTSMDDRCVPHTECPQGYTAEVAGTDRSDTVCVKNKRVHIIVGILVGIIVVALIIVGVFLYCRGNQSLENGKKMKIACVECIGPRGQTTIYKPQEETPFSIAPQTPVENEDASIPEMFSEEIGRSENGKVVCPVEEDGKMARLPRQESHISSSSTINFNQ